MHVEDGVAQHANRRDRIDALPEHVARIVIAADAFAGDLAQLEHGFGTVDHEPRMHFDRDLYAVILGELADFGPVRSNLLLPLPFQDVEILWRPWTRHPVGIFSFVG